MLVRLNVVITTKTTKNTNDKLTENVNHTTT